MKLPKKTIIFIGTGIILVLVGLFLMVSTYENVIHNNIVFVLPLDVMPLDFWLGVIVFAIGFFSLSIGAYLGFVHHPKPITLAKSAKIT